MASLMAGDRLQVGVAAYIVAHLQNEGADRIGKVLDQTRFWDGVRTPGG
jgi:hypothetical protein